MPDPTLNPDGTRQVAAPTQSAFAHQPTQSGQLPPQAAASPHTSATPGFSGALLDAIKALVSQFAPKGLTQAGPNMNEAIEAQSQGNPAPPVQGSAPLGQHF